MKELSHLVFSKPISHNKETKKERKKEKMKVDENRELVLTASLSNGGSCRSSVRYWIIGRDEEKDAEM